MKKKNIFKVLIGLCFVLLGVNCGGDDGGDEGPQLSVSPTSVNLAGTEEVKINVTANVTWNVSVDASWLHVINTGGSRNGSFTIYADDNTTGNARSTRVHVKAERANVETTISVTQSASGTPVDNPVLTVSTTRLDFSAAGGDNTFTISSNVSWTVSSDQAWCTASPQSGSNNGTITVNATANPESYSRTATLTITGNSITRKITVTQDQKAVDYTLTVDPTSLQFGAGEETQSITVTSNDSWTVESNQSWCKLSVSSGSSNGTVNVTVSENTTASSRSARITFKGTNSGVTREVNVTQDQPDDNGGTIGRDDYGNDVNLNNK